MIHHSDISPENLQNLNIRKPTCPATLQFPTYQQTKHPPFQARLERGACDDLTQSLNLDLIPAGPGEEMWKGEGDF